MGRRRGACSPLTESDPPPTEAVSPIGRRPWYGPGVHRAAAIKQGYTTGARSLATRSIKGLARTRVTPNALTATGVTLCAAASIVVLFERHNEMLFFWVGAALFVAGSILDIL